MRAYRLRTRATLPRRGGPPSMKEAARPPLRRRSGSEVLNGEPSENLLTRCYNAVKRFPAVMWLM